jgi:hypothetical protein
MAQWKSDTQAFDQLISRRYEAMVLADANGDVNNPYHPIYTVDDRGGYTSKNRLKVSAYQTVFFNTFQYGLESDVWDESTANSGSSVHNANTNNVDMIVTSAIGSQVIRQTRNTMRYIPGRTSTLTYALRLGITTPGIRKRIGLFDENDGFFFEFGDEGDYHCVVRSKTTGAVVDRRVDRADWNGDKLDGTGPSGIILNVNTQQMINFEYEWYGAGQVIFSFTIDGRSHVIHTFNHANDLTVPWASTPFLPIRLEITNTTGGQAGGPFYLHQGSNSLISEGVPDKLGLAENITTPITGRTMTNANTFYPILSIRLKSTALKGIVLPTFFQSATVDNTSVFYKLVKNATLTGANFVDMPDGNAFTQYDLSATSFTGGRDLDSGFVISGSGTGIRLDENTVYQLGRSSMGTVSDTLTLCIACPNANKSALAAMTWIEQR